MPTDVNDASKAGYSIEDLIADADGEDPVLGSSTAKLAEAGLKVLRDLSSTVQAAQGRDEAIRAILEAQGDEAARRAIAVACYQRRADAATHLSGLQLGPKGLSTTIRQFQKVIDAEVEVVSRKAAEREDRYRGMVLDKLTEKLGVSGLRMPAGWEMDRDGLRGDDGSVITRAPILVSGVAHDVNTGKYRLMLSWLRDGAWITRPVERAAALNHRRLAELADDQAPVTTVNASDVVRFIDAFEAVNAEKLRPKMYTEHLGWVGDMFVYGDASIGGEIGVLDLPATRRFVAGASSGGTWEGWCDVVKRYILARPLALIGIYASAASVLLGPLNQPGFVVDWSGLTSRGKTTTLRGAASVHGIPDDNGNGLILSWETPSQAALMYSAYALQSLPLIVDDTKRMKHRPEIVAAMIYDHAAGQDRLRGTVDGKIRPVNRWRSVLLTTGEAPITSFSQDGGARARSLCLRGSPYGDETGRNSMDASSVRAELMKNYGHMGRRLVDSLVRGRDRWPALRRRFEEIRDSYVTGAPSAIACRLYEHVSVIHLAAELCHKLGMPGDEEEAMRVLAAAVEESLSEANLPQAAAEAVYRWASSCQDRFWRRTGSADQRPPHGGWLGRWDADGWEYIAFNPEALRGALLEWDYDYASIIEAWREHGWIKLDSSGENPRVGPGRSRLLCVKREAFGHGCDE